MDKFNNPVYMNKTDVFYRLPSIIDLEEFWNDLQNFRKKNSIALELKNQNRDNFYICLTEHLKESIVEIDDLARKNIFEDLKEEVKNELIKITLEEEAYYSSTVEGVAIGFERVKKLTEETEMPKNTDEKKIVNNHKALKYIMNNLDKEIDEQLITDIHKIISAEIQQEEKYRTEQSYIKTIGKVTYVSPMPDEIKPMMNDLIKFINLNSDLRLHPLLKVSIIHFYLVYIHPFSTGNGRLARAVTLMYLLKNGFDIFKYFPVSYMLKDQKTKYYRAIVEVEEYENDITYFCTFYTELMIKNIQKIMEDFNKNYKLKVIESKAKDLGFGLNKRQLKLIERVLKYSVKSVDIEYYKKLNKVTQETARKDMEMLVEMDIFHKEKQSKKFVYIIIEN